MKKTITRTLLFLLTSASLFSCAFAPVNNQYEKAGTLQKGTVELSGNYSHYAVTGGGESEGANNNYGFRVGYGISDKFDLKLRYERLVPTGAFSFDDDDASENVKGINYISLVPKFAIVEKKLSFLIPVSFYSYKETLDDTQYNNRFVSIAPQLIYTSTARTNKADVTFGLKADGIFGEGGGAVLLGATVGAGFSSNLDKWAVRPEIGASFLGGGAFVSFGIGLQLMIPKNKK
jgi:hypothetical protein